MIEYEMLYIVHARKNVDEATAVVERVNELITSAGGEVLSDDNWGRRRFAYPIDHEAEGTYVLVTMKLAPEATRELESQLVISEDIVRHMLIKGIIPFEGPDPQRLERPAALPPLAAAPVPISAPDDGGAGGPAEGAATTEAATDEATSDEAATDGEPAAVAEATTAAATEEATTDEAEPEAATEATTEEATSDEAETEATTEAESAEETTSPPTTGAE